MLIRMWHPITKLIKERKEVPKKSKAEHNLLTLPSNLIALCPFISPRPVLLYISDSLSMELYHDLGDGEIQSLKCCHV